MSTVHIERDCLFRIFSIYIHNDEVTFREECDQHFESDPMTRDEAVDLLESMIKEIKES